MTRGVSRSALLWAAGLIGPVVTVLWPDLDNFGPILLFVGFCLMVGMALFVTFRRYRVGSFALYTKPKEYMATKFNEQELLVMRACSLIALSGLLAIIVRVLLTM